MSDILKTNLPAEENAGKLEELNVPEVTPEITVSDMETEDSTDTVASGAVGKLSKEEILSKLSDLVEVSVEEVAAVKLNHSSKPITKFEGTKWKSSKKRFRENGRGQKRLFCSCRQSRLK